MLSLVTTNLDVRIDIKSAIYGLSAQGLILGGYLSIKNKR